jgi:MinD-like ATPase involved in chromosome partitioning or flagellar assembly
MISKALAAGRPVVAAYPDAPSSKEIIGLAAKLSKIIMDQGQASALSPT